MRTVALDLGTKSLSYCEIADGQVIARTTARRLEDLDAYLGAKTAPARVAFEACREAWHVHDVLAAHGHEPWMLDTTRTRRLGVGQHGRKTDRLDAEALARALARGDVPLAHVLSPARRALREQLALRGALVATRAQYVTMLRGLARAAGTPIGSCAPQDFVAKVAAARLPAATRTRLAPLLQLLTTLEVQLAQTEQALAQLCAQEPVIDRLATVPGVGQIVAATFVAALDDAGRFHDGHAVASYLGLVPGEHTSGGPEQRRLGAITKQGNPHARAMLVQAAWTLLRTAAPDDPLRLWATQLATRRSRPVAVIALARRLAGVLFALWRDDTAYEPVRAALSSARGLRAAAQATTFRAAALTRSATKLARQRRAATRGAGKEVRRAG